MFYALTDEEEGGASACPISGAVALMAPPLAETAIMNLQTGRCQRSRFSLRSNR